MKEKCEFIEYVQHGFRILLPSFSGYIGQQLSKQYGDGWWNEVLYTLHYPKELPFDGPYKKLVDSLDIANCIRLLDWMWSNMFRNLLPVDCRNYAKELMGVRNIVSHAGAEDIEQPMAERALDTMALLCKEIDPDACEEIRNVYNAVRARAYTNRVPVYTGLNQPETDSARGELIEGSLLKQLGTELVQKTTLTRKVSYGGKTEVYPVYRVRLDALYYNDQNDRIATWITRYESENGKDSLTDLNVEIYNRIIENFICESNPEAIQKTQKNIGLVGQREPGVALSDGRIVDGNRRFTCLRRLQRDSSEPLYFETVIIDWDIQADKKQIKLLELAIQHGEEKKVDYDLIDYSIGTYRDIVQTGLLTVEEYADNANEKVGDVKKRIEIAEMICEFLEYLKLPEQYHIAREFQVYDMFQEIQPSLKKVGEELLPVLKELTFNNAVMKAFPDQRKFARDINKLVKNGIYEDYFAEQEKWGQLIREKYAEADIRNKDDIDRFAEDNADITEELRLSMEMAMLRFRSVVLKSKPSENVTKSITLMTDIDSRLFGKMDEEEKGNFKAELDELSKIIRRFQELL